MATIKFTKSLIRDLPAPDPSGKPTLYWPKIERRPRVSVFCDLCQRQQGWVFQRNLANGKSRRITLGPVAGLTPEQAWALAAPMLTAMLGGQDPRHAPRRQMASMTVAEVLEDYLGASSNLVPTVKMYRFAAKHLDPLLNRALREITADDLERRFRAITADVSARRAKGEIRGGVKAGKATANAALRLLGSRPGSSRPSATAVSAPTRCAADAFDANGTTLTVGRDTSRPTGSPRSTLQRKCCRLISSATW